MLQLQLAPDSPIASLGIHFSPLKPWHAIFCVGSLSSRPSPPRGKASHHSDRHWAHTVLIATEISGPLKNPG